MSVNVSVQRYRATNKIRQSLIRRLISSKVSVPALFLIVIITFACLYIWQRVYVLDLAKDISNLEREKQTLTDQLRKTNAEVAELSRLSRIEPMVADRLGLARTGSGSLFTLQTKKKVEVKREGIDNVVSTIEKLAHNLPVITESKADTLGYFEKNGH